MNNTPARFKIAIAASLIFVSAFLLCGCKEQTNDEISRCWNEARDSAWELLVAKAKGEDNRQFKVVYEEINQARIAAYTACISRKKP